MPDNRQQEAQQGEPHDGERRVKLHPVTPAKPGVNVRRPSAPAGQKTTPAQKTARTTPASPASPASTVRQEKAAPRQKTAANTRKAPRSAGGRPEKRKPRYLELDEDSAATEAQTVAPNGGRPGEDELREREYRIRVAGQIGRVRHIWQNILTAVIVLAVSAAVLFGLIRMIFSVGDITLSGNEKYSSQTIRGCLGFDYGDFLPTLSGEKAEKTILAACPYVTAVSVEKVYPNKITVTVTEGTPVWRTAVGQETALLSDTLRVMEIAAPSAVPQGLPELILPEIVRAVEGEGLTLALPEAADTVLAISACADRVAQAHPILSLDVTDRRRITMNCEGNITVILGDKEDLPVKMEVALKILADSLVLDADGAVLNVSDPHEATLKLK